ncbi:GxxExxY protein, partial [Xanthomonas citri pv. citri]
MNIIDVHFFIITDFADVLIDCTDFCCNNSFFVMNNKDLKFPDITGKIIGCAMKVHQFFGQGFPENIYQRALIIELEKVGLKCRSEVEKDVYYEEHFIGKRRLDLIIEDVVLVELKAIAELDKASYNKIVNYLKVFKIEV